ncbi:MAG: FtsX-like permease family protein [Dehalococcoidia bacterium]|nr:FtsX-like permease family protein [Dehalococcoidia bacterium]
MRPLLTLALWRSTSGKGLLALLGAGMLVAAALLAAAPIYSRAMADLGLTFAIRDELEGSEWTRVTVPRVGLGNEEGESLRTAVDQRITERLSWFEESRARFTRLGRFAAYHQDEPEKLRVPLGIPWSMPGYESHVRVVEGRLPAATAPGAPIEVAASAAGARVMDVEVGQTFELREWFDNCERVISTEVFPPPPPPCDTTATVTFTIPVTLVGIIEPQDQEDPFWLRTTDLYFQPLSVLNDIGVNVPIVMEESVLYGEIANDHPHYLVDVSWHVFVDTEVLDRANHERALEDLQGLYRELEPYNVFATSPLRDTLQQFTSRASYQQTPLTVLLLQITVIALFYVALVAAVVVERQAAEIALLRGRGATVLQVLVLYALQALLIGIPLLILAPFVAAALTASLGYTPAFADVSEGALPVTVTARSFAFAAGGVALSVLALLLPVLVLATRGALAQRRSESRPRASFFQRYYLDLALAGAAILLLLELDQRETVFTPSATGGISSDPLLLASPALAMGAAAALLVRFVPLILKVVSRLSTAVAGPATALGLWQLVRNSGQYTRLTLLLMMAVAVGTFAASYATTTEQSYEDQANYRAGVELRAFSSTGEPPALEPAAFAAQVEELPGVTAAYPVIRTDGSPAIAGSSTEQYQVLGIDPEASSMIWQRGDFAGGDLAPLLRQIRPPAAEPGKALPGDPVAISVWMKPKGLTAGVIVRAGVIDADGRYFRADLGEIDPAPEWQELSGSLIPEYFEPLTPPLHLVSLTASEPVSRVQDRHFLVDDISVTDRAGTATLVEGFEAPGGWTLLPDREPVTDTWAVGAEGARSGAAGGKFAFKPQTGTGTVHGLYVNSFRTPLPVVVSQSYLDTTGRRPGDTTLLTVGSDSLVPVTIAGAFELLPTAPQDDGPVIVLDRDALLEWTTIASPLGYAAFGPNEVWVDVAPGADEEALVAALRGQPFALDQAVSRAEELRRADENPLIAAGGSGILAISFVAVLGLVAAALVMQLLSGVARRRVEFAVVRALGVSRSQLIRMLLLEYGVVAVAGVVAGVVVGLFVSGQMLSFLEVTEAGTRVEPPFQLKTEWVVVAGAVVVVAGACLAALTRVGIRLARSNDPQALRSE